MFANFACGDGIFGGWRITDMKLAANTVSFWFNNARHVSLPQSLFPAVLSVCLAANHLEFSFLYAMLAVVGVGFTHLGMNLLDDYFDYKNQQLAIREELAENNTFARIGKCDYLLSGKATVKELFVVASLFLLVAVSIGAVVSLHRGIVIVWIVLLGGFLGVFYSAKPFSFGYHGFGELLVGTMFGPLLMGGVFYACCGTYSMQVALLSTAVGLLVTNILFTHSILDYHPDKQTGKKTLAVLIRSKKGLFVVACLFNSLPFVLVGLGIYICCFPLVYLLVFLALPMAGGLIYLLAAFFRSPQRSFSPSWWMLPMENWEKISRAGIDWFMIRWYLSRNLTMFFCLLAMLAALVHLITDGMV